MNRPVIGITLDCVEEGEYAATAWYAMRENYFGSIARAGGSPIALPHQPDLVDHYANLIDGLVLTGGDFDIPPSAYGAKEVHEKTITKENRTAFETAILNSAIKRNIPVLGICGGEQLICVVLGGTLIQHIPDEVENAVLHEVKDRDNPAHQVTIIEETMLHSIIGETEIGTNTTHHQAVLDPGPECIVSAIASDGVIEGIEYPDHPFCLGVQWHPEYESSAADTNILKAFIQAAR